VSVSRSPTAVNQNDLVDLLKGGVDGAAGRWAELGAGEGNFTLALAELLGPGAHIIAVDKDRHAMRELAARMGRTYPQTRLDVRVADFTKPLGLQDLDGIVMANSLHFVGDKRPVLQAIRAMLKPSGRLVLVEYGSDRGNPWVPHPISFETWRRLAEEAGLQGTALLHTVPSRYLGSIYSALSFSGGRGQGEGSRRPA
jgi:SAM-dependent methyltransferase